MGLAIARHDAELMKGDISVVSEKGQGSTFTVTLILGKTDLTEEEIIREREKETASAAAAASPSLAETVSPKTAGAGEEAGTMEARDAAGADTASGEKTGGFASSEGQAEEETEDYSSVSLEGRHVLIVEDMELNAEILEDLLDMEDITAEIAQNGQIAVDKFCDNPPGHFDAILMDLRMPVMDGLEATRIIRSQDREDARKIPIIALTANAFKDDKINALESGMDVYMSKPVNYDQLFDVLRRALA